MTEGSGQTDVGYMGDRSSGSSQVWQGGDVCTGVPFRVPEGDCPRSRAQGLGASEGVDMQNAQCRGGLWVRPGGFKVSRQFTILPDMQKRERVVRCLSGPTCPRAERPRLYTHLATGPGHRPEGRDR